MVRNYSIKELRRIVKKRKYKMPISKKAIPFYRLIRRQFFIILRYFAFLCARLWLRKIKHYERLPKGPAIIVSNHLSYYDWALLSAIYWNQYLVFIGNQDLANRPFVNWLIRLNILILIDPKNPGLKYFKESLGRLREGYVLVIYPEGMRSRSGKMLEPKTGFIKIAVKTKVPIVPIAMRGTYQILPPGKRFPAFRRCDIIVGEPMKIDRKNPLFKDIYSRKGVGDSLNELDEKEIAFRIMEKIRIMAGQEWEG